MSEKNKSRWDKDVLSRDKTAETLIKFILKRYSEEEGDEIYQDSFVLNLNAQWGHGKTYFLKNIKEDLDKKKYPTIYFDAWKNDFTSNPLVGFISEINKELSQYSKGPSKEAIDNLKEKGIIVAQLMGGMILNYGMNSLGINKDIITEGLTTNSGLGPVNNLFKDDHFNSLVSQHKSIGESITNFRDSLSEFIDKLKEINVFKPPLFILVDELDRCRPNYAIELLENIKHLFNVKGVIFVIASNTKELSNSVNAIYGNKFDSRRYLKRFFDIEFTFSKPNTIPFVKHLQDKYRLNYSENFFLPLTDWEQSSNFLTKTISDLFDSLDLGLRDQDQIMSRVKTTLLISELETIHIFYLIILTALHFKDEDYIRNIPTFLASENNHASSLKINYCVYRKDNGSQENVDLYEILKIYHELSMMNLNQIRPNSYEYGPRQVISQRIISDTNFSKLPTISTYPDLVMQAGHFSS